MPMSQEQLRLKAAREQSVAWKKWGPYLSERQWGTVREDYSENGDAWNFFTHDQARSRAYRWGEDGLAGISDDQQRLCFSLALWNGKDAILKERLFGLTNSEGNHGEDVKEYYFYLDSTPTHSYMKCLYKYPQSAFPYADLVETNRRRNRNDMEYELLDTGIFNEDRYFDVFVEYAKAGPEDILVRITAANRGPDAADLHLLPTLWFRNDWSSWIAEEEKVASTKSRVYRQFRESTPLTVLSILSAVFPEDAMTARFSIVLRSLPSSPHFQTGSRAGRIDAMPPTPPRSAGSSREEKLSTKSRVYRQFRESTPLTVLSILSAVFPEDAMTARFSIVLRSLPSSPHFQTARCAGRIDAMPPTPPRSAGSSRFPASRRGAAAAMRRGLETRHLRALPAVGSTKANPRARHQVRTQGVANPHPARTQRLLDHSLEGQEILILLEKRPPADATIEDMVNHAPREMPRCV